MRIHSSSTIIIAAGLLLLQSTTAFVAPTSRRTTTATTTPLHQSSYDDDDDDDRTATLTMTSNTNGEHHGVDAATSKDGYYASLLESVGLDISDTKQLLHFSSSATRTNVPSSEVFCNRELQLGKIKAIGFDMDYTLAEYQQPAFDRLAFDGAKEKLVQKLGYPQAVLELEYDHTRWTRGLIIDIQRGNFLKMDRHKYVRVAQHGFTPISSTTRKHLYSRAFNKVVSFSEKHFVNMDTLFQFVDADLFAALIELKDCGETEFLDGKTYEELYRDIRESVDLCHRDGVIKDTVAENPEEYIVYNPEIFPMLERFRNAGIQVFLLTNSYWEYTSEAMNYLYHGKHVDKETKLKNEWVVGSCKPQYMLDGYLSLFRVNPQDGSLLNTDGLYDIAALGGAQPFLAQGKTFQGGNWKHLQALLEIQAGEEILYVGDHLYSDVLRSKRTLGWRSAFIMPELEEEMNVFEEQVPLLQKITQLRQLRDDLGAVKDALELELEDCSNYDEDEEEDECRTELYLKLGDLAQDDLLLKNKLTELLGTWHQSFHPTWGAMFNAGYQDSRFAFFVENYACLYTSRASNLGLSSTSRSFRTTGEMLPHDTKLLRQAAAAAATEEEEMTGVEKE